MSLFIYLFLSTCLGGYLGERRVKSRMKKAAYIKHFNVNHTYVGNRITTLTERELGFCDGMTYIVEEVTNEHLTYWEG